MDFFFYKKFYSCIMFYNYLFVFLNNIRLNVFIFLLFFRYVIIGLKSLNIFNIVLLNYCFECCLVKGIKVKR